MLRNIPSVWTDPECAGHWPWVHPCVGGFQLSEFTFMVVADVVKRSFTLKHCVYMWKQFHLRMTNSVDLPDNIEWINIKLHVWIIPRDGNCRNLLQLPAGGHEDKWRDANELRWEREMDKYSIFYTHLPDHRKVCVKSSFLSCVLQK